MTENGSPLSSTHLTGQLGIAIHQRRRDVVALGRAGSSASAGRTAPVDQCIHEELAHREIGLMHSGNCSAPRTSVSALGALVGAAAHRPGGGGGFLGAGSTLATIIVIATGGGEQW